MRTFSYECICMNVMVRKESMGGFNKNRVSANTERIVNILFSEISAYLICCVV